MSIKNWPASERPREKLLTQGATALSDAELLAILLRTGISGISAVGLAKNLLHNLGGLRALLSANQETICQQKGMGIASYTQFAVIREICKRMLAEEMGQQPVFDTPDSVAQFLKLKIGHEPVEVCLALLLNQHHQLLQTVELSRGTVTENTVYIREIAKTALQHHASALILAHNHPSGSTEPSHADVEMTQQLQYALTILDIQLLDHLIITPNNAISMASLGYTN